MERSVFPISRWFPLPCTPPTPALQPGLHCCLWDCCRLAACHCTPHSLTKNNEATKGVIERLRYWCTQTSRSCSCRHNSYVRTHGRDGDRYTLLYYTVQDKTEIKLVVVLTSNDLSTWKIKSKLVEPPMQSISIWHSILILCWLCTLEQNNEWSACKVLFILTLT